jgi:hypothetical protein
MRYFQAASMAAGERLNPTSKAETMVVSSMPTQISPTLSTSGIAARPATNQSRSA